MTGNNTFGIFKEEIEKATHKELYDLFLELQRQKINAEIKARSGHSKRQKNEADKHPDIKTIRKKIAIIKTRLNERRIDIDGR